MRVSDNLQILRKNKGVSQEELARILEVSRQAIGKWENGQSLPELDKLIQLSDYYGVSLDSLIKNVEDCNLKLTKSLRKDYREIIQFLIRAKQSTYAGYGNQIEPSRRSSHDLSYEEGELFYLDTYLGGERFSGEEALWKDTTPIWSMNYTGRVLGEQFNGDFLKSALKEVPMEIPYRGPRFFQQGLYTYHNIVTGEFEWFQGYEEILYDGYKIYECYYHGGLVR